MTSPCNLCKNYEILVFSPYVRKSSVPVAGLAKKGNENGAMKYINFLSRITVQEVVLLLATRCNCANLNPATTEFEYILVS